MIRRFESNDQGRGFEPGSSLFFMILIALLEQACAERNFCFVHGHKPRFWVWEVCGPPPNLSCCQTFRLPETKQGPGPSVEMRLPTYLFTIGPCLYQEKYY